MGRLQDYRQLDERFDCAFSLGMFEHVGVRNYRHFFNVVRRCLPAHGLFLLHTIANNRSTHHTDPWIAKYIFPNSMLPSPAQIAGAVEGGFVLEDWHNFGVDYDRTLIAWRAISSVHGQACRGAMTIDSGACGCSTWRVPLPCFALGRRSSGRS